MNNRVLVTGGAGYIGSHTALQLVESGNEVVVLDNLYSGHRWAIPSAAKFYQGNIHDQGLVRKIISECRIDSVIHFAGHVVVPESVENPAKYYQNNVVGSMNLIETCIEQEVNQFVFSSSAAVYGIPEQCPVNEHTETSPINPYGVTKLITEWNLRDFAAASPDFNFVALRYFNVAGAHMGGGLRSSMSIFGDDYPTEDGSCIRDYIHVDDLAAAHLDALAYLNEDGSDTILNCGYGNGYSVKQVVDCVKSVSGVDFDVILEPRRSGDPPQLIANNSKIKQVLNWQPKYNDLATICRSACKWEQKLQARLIDQ